jgi:hypothetical protein
MRETILTFMVLLRKTSSRLDLDPDLIGHGANERITTPELDLSDG